MGARVSIPNSAVMCRTWRQWGYRLGTNVDIPFEVVSDEDRAGLAIYCDRANRLQVDAGAGFQPIGPDPDVDAVQLGAFTAGQRKTITVRLSFSDAIRLDEPQLLLDEGVGTTFGPVGYHAGGGAYAGEDGGYHGGGI